MGAKRRAARRGGGILLAGLAIAGLAFPIGASRAQIVSPKTGKELAEKLCTACHIVGAETAGQEALADVPSFMEIAKKPGQTAETIAGSIVIPHPAMPQIDLTRDEIADLAAYILSLRKS